LPPRLLRLLQLRFQPRPVSVHLSIFRICLRALGEADAIQPVERVGGSARPVARVLASAATGRESAGIPRFCGDRSLPAITRQARGGMSRQTAGECIWPDRPFDHPQRHSSQDRPAGRDEHRQHRSLGDRHARNGAHAVWHISRTAPTTAQQTTMRRMKTESTRTRSSIKA
jgi:hypothetical protein